MSDKHAADIQRLTDAIHGLIESHRALRAAEESERAAIAALAPEGAYDWMSEEATRLKLVEAGAPIVQLVIDDMHAETVAYGAIAAAYPLPVSA